MHLLLRPLTALCLCLCLSVVLLGDEPPLAITAVLHGDDAQRADVELVLRRVDGTGEPIARTLSAPGLASIALDAGNWELAVRSPRFWAAPLVVSRGQAVTLDLWPAGRIRGTVKGRGGAKVGSLRVLFDGGEPGGASECTVDGERWQCLVPAGTHDLRLLSPGFAAEFRWQQQITAAEENDLGSLVLRPGASLIGYVTTARGVSAALREVVVTARPRSVSGGAAPRSYTASANPRGFFQIAGLPAGDYVVAAASKPRLRSDERIATVLEGRNAELRAPLMLDTPRKLVLKITPQEAWQVHLYRRDRDAGSVDDAGVSAAERDGTWTSEVAPGEYFVEIGRADGSVWHSADVAVSAEDVQLDVAVPAERVSGTLRLGTEPLASARLIFGGEQGARKSTLVTDTDGRFAGEVPSSGDGWTITIESDAPRVKRTAEFTPHRDDGQLRFDIVLPRTVVQGRVVDEDGSAASGSFVTLRSPDGKVFEQASTDAGGRFELFGFDAGVYRIQADAFQRASEVLEIQASESEPLEVEITLRKVVLVRGRVQSRHTAGVEARLTALQREVATQFVPTAHTDGDGLFELKLPPRTRTFDLLVLAPGFAVSSGRVLIQDGKLLTLTVDPIGGELIVEMPRSADAFIRHDGAEFPARWFVAQAGGTVSAGEEWTIANAARVEAGEYALCAGGRCETGVLAPNGSLFLSLRKDGTPLAID